MKIVYNEKVKIKIAVIYLINYSDYCCLSFWRNFSVLNSSFIRNQIYKNIRFFRSIHISFFRGLFWNNFRETIDSIRKHIQKFYWMFFTDFDHLRIVYCVSCSVRYFTFIFQSIFVNILKTYQLSSTSSKRRHFY